MTGKERIANILKRKPVDRIGLYEHFWGDTKSTWTKQGHITDDTDFQELFDYDLELTWPLNFTANLDYVPEVLEETEDTILTRDGNSAVLRRHKLHDTTPEHVDFLVKDHASWKEAICPVLKPEKRRIDFGKYLFAKEKARRRDAFFCLSGVNVFELMHPVCGHENMLMGMILEPDWIREMVDTFSDHIIKLQEMIFSEAGLPDGIWYYEDMGFKEKPFMSPAMYREFLLPAHKKTIDFAKSLGLPVIMHSCGFVEPLIPGMLEAGIDCLQVIEVKAGMDLLRIHKTYRDNLSLMGGIDVRALYTNDKKIIDRELEDKIPVVKEGYGYVLHSDHSIPNTVDFEIYKYFIEKGMSLGQYR
ncbi:MAG: uroporphyrinogen decarboxylase family protein [Clostridia bacterium]